MLRSALVLLVLLLPAVALAQNQPPVADAGEDQTIFLGEAITLNGSAIDPDGDQIVGWQWEVISAPVGSSPLLFDATFPNATFTTDVVGVYALTQ
jgi:hypothetical protein